MQPVLTGQVMGAVTEGPGSHLIVIITALVLVFIADSLLQFGIAVFSGRTGERFIFNLRRYSTDLLSRIQLGIKLNLEPADIHSRIQTDTALANSVFVGTIPRAISSFTLSMGCIIGMLIAMPNLFALIITIIAFTSTAAFAVSKIMKRQYKTHRENAAVFSGRLWQLIGELPTFKARNAESWAANNVDCAAEIARGSATKVDITGGVMMPILNIGTQLCIVVSILITATSIATGDISSAQGTTFLMFLLYAVSPLVELGSMAAGLSAGVASLDRLKELWSLRTERDTGQNQGAYPDKPSLKFQDITYSFPDAERPVIDQFSTEISGPGLFLLRGANGRGKSTLLFLANGVFPSDGTVTVNGRDAKDLTLASWREQVFLVSQERNPIVGTLRDNLGAGGKYSDDERIYAIQFSGFAEHYNDLNMSIGGDEGVNLSGGQRALLALSDAILRDPPILLLDEITAGIDRATVPRIRALLLKLSQRCLILAVSHDELLSEVAQGEIEFDKKKSPIETQL